MIVPPPILTKFVVKGFRVIPSIGGESEQAAGIMPSDLRTDRGVVFLRRRAVNVGVVERLNADESGKVQRTDPVVARTRRQCQETEQARATRARHSPRLSLSSSVRRRRERPRGLAVTLTTQWRERPVV